MFLTQHLWKNLKKKNPAQVILRSHVTCQEHNSGKTKNMGHDQKPKPQGLMNTFNRPYPMSSLCGGLKHVLVIIYLFSGLVEAFPCQKLYGSKMAD